MRLVWTTDLHLNHVDSPAWERWLDRIRDQSADGLVISGDISEGDDVTSQLRRIAESVDLPIYFVLGNHDFYQSSIGQTRRSVIELCREHPRLFYLTDCQTVRLTDGVSLVGDDGWGDGTVGDYSGSKVRLNDFQQIDDFVQADPARWPELLRREGAGSAGRLTQKLSSLPSETEVALVVTHVPPFRESCWYEGHTTDDHWAPFFVCGEVGNALREADESVPRRRLTVLCGHTHHEGVAKMSETMEVHTGAADYGNPNVVATLEVGESGVRVVYH